MFLKLPANRAQGNKPKSQQVLSMQIGPRHVVALLSWGITAVMMHPSFASLIAMLVNAVLLALLVYSPSNKVKRHA